jgi:hypothetical protein
MFECRLPQESDIQYYGLDGLRVLRLSLMIMTGYLDGWAQLSGGCRSGKNADH